MPASGIKFGPGWKRFAKLLRPGKFQQSLEKHVGQASAKIAPRLAKAMRLELRKASTEKNTALTIAIKRSTKPLIDFADLFKAITAKKMAWDLVFGGVFRTSENFNIAVVLHNGKSIPVTAKMRGLFLVLAQASRAAAQGGVAPQLTGRAAELFARFQNWLPLRPETRLIKIPARPFARQAIDDPGVQRMAIELWSQGVQRALEE